MASPVELGAEANQVLSAWALHHAQAKPLAGGLINNTFAVEQIVDGVTRPVGVLQRLHPVFGPEVNFDIEAVTEHLIKKGEVSPRLWRTATGQAWVPGVAEPARVWRMLTWVDGKSVDRVPRADWAHAGGELVGRFHRAVADLDWQYRFVRSGVHDTKAHLAKLATRLATAADTPRAHQPPWLAAACELGHQIVAAIDWSFDIAAMPARHIHGDLKISNLLFSSQPVRGVCLVDLDTVGRGTLAFELGDAMRSWCNPHGEDAGSIRFDLPIFKAAMEGYLDVMGASVSPDERRSVVYGLQRVCVELAARFCVDVFDDNYFGWDATRFASRREHNVVRAQGQLALAQAVALQLPDALGVLA